MHRQETESFRVNDSGIEIPRLGTLSALTEDLFLFKAASFASVKENEVFGKRESNNFRTLKTLLDQLPEGASLIGDLRHSITKDAPERMIQLLRDLKFIDHNPRGSLKLIVETHELHQIARRAFKSYLSESPEVAVVALSGSDQQETSAASMLSQNNSTAIDLLVALYREAIKHTPQESLSDSSFAERVRLAVRYHAESTDDNFIILKALFSPHEGAGSEELSEVVDGHAQVTKDLIIDLTSVHADFNLQATGPFHEGLIRMERLKRPLVVVYPADSGAAEILEVLQFTRYLKVFNELDSARNFFSNSDEDRAT